jgi:hypothetical protein
MGKLINCECGQVIQAETDEDLLARADAHIQQDHPDLVGHISHADLLAMAEVS